MDKIIINNFSIEAFIGVCDWEKQTKQELILQLTLGLSTNFTNIEDRLEHTVDYREVVDCVQEFVSERHFHLLEVLSNSVTDQLFMSFKAINWIKLQIIKPRAITGAALAGIEIERFRD